MITRKFGKTGHQAKIITLGGAGFWTVDQDTADKAMELAMSYDLNTIDVAPSYGLAEDRIGPWMKKHRDRFFIAEKTMERTKEGALRELHQSLEKLHSKKFELYQFHAVMNLEELDRILAEGGAYEAFKKAKETGLIDGIGLTCHDDMRVPLKAMEKIPELEVLLIPVNFAAKAFPNPVNDFEPVLRQAQDRDLGITAIKAISIGRWNSEAEKQKSGANTWYRPLTEPKLIEKAVHFTLSQEGVTAYSLAAQISLWKYILEAGESFQPMTVEEQENLIQYARDHNYRPLFPE